MLNRRILSVFLPLFAFLILFYSCYISLMNVSVSEEELTDLSNLVAMIKAEPAGPSLKVFGRYFTYVNTPYQGSQKSWILYPFLKIFGASADFARYTNIFFAMIYLYSMYWAAKAVISRKLAFLVFLIPFLDTKFLLYIPTDFGPFILQIIFIALSLGGIFRFMKSENIWWWVFSNFAIGEILAQKITSLPVFLTLLIFNNAYFIKIYFRKVFTFSILKYVFLSIILLILTQMHFLYYFYKFGLEAFLNMTKDSEVVNILTFWPKLKNVFLYFISSFDGSYFVKGVTLISEVKSVGPIFGYFSVFTIILGIFILKLKDKNDFYFYILFYMFVLSLFLFTSIRGLTRSHHYFILHPIFYLLFIYSYFLIWKNYKENKIIKLLLKLIIAVFVILMLCNAIFLNTFIKNNKGTALGSMAIYEVTNYLKKNRAKRIYGMNFSVSSPIYYLSGGNIKTENYTWVSMDNGSLLNLIKNVKSDNDLYMVIRRSTNYDWSKDWMDYLNRDDLLKDLIEHPGKYGVTLKIFSDKRGTSFYVIK